MFTCHCGDLPTRHTPNQQYRSKLTLSSNPQKQKHTSASMVINRPFIPFDQQVIHGKEAVQVCSAVGWLSTSHPLILPSALIAGMDMHLIPVRHGVVRAMPGSAGDLQPECFNRNPARSNRVLNNDLETADAMENTYPQKGVNKRSSVFCPQGLVPLIRAMNICQNEKW